MSKSPNIANLASGFRSSNKLNENFAAIATAFGNTVSLDGSTPNAFTADLDLNGNQILNLPTPVGDTDVVRLQDLHDYIDPIPYVEDLVDAAEAASATAVAAEAGAVAAEAGAVAAEATTVGYRDQALVYRDDTAIYAGTTNIDNFYADTTTGLAGTASGDYFGVITTATDGVAIYLDNAGSAVFQQTLPSINYVVKHQQVIPCEVVGGTKRAPIIRPINTWTVLTGDLATGTATLPHYIFTFKATLTNDEAGSYSVTIQNGDGSPFLGATALTDSSVVTPAIGAIQAGKLVEFFRRDAGEGSALEWIQRPDTTTIPQAETMISMEYKTPKPLRPVHVVQVGDNLTLIQVRLNTTHYSDVTYANQSDHLKIGYMNVGPFMALTGPLMALNSMWGHMKNKDIEFGNFVYDALDSGTTVETGLVWSAFEGVFITGDMADAGDTANWGTNFQLAGRAHGHLETPPTISRYGYRKDTSTGTPTAATKGANLTVTLPGTTVSVGERVRFSGVVGMTELNNTWFTVTGKAGTPTVLTFAGVDSTSWGTFTSAVGYAEREQVLTTVPAPNTEWAGTRLVQNASGFFKTPGGVRAASFADITTFEPLSDSQILYTWTIDYTAASGITPGTRQGGYAVMCPLTGANRGVGYVNGVKGSVQILDKRDSSTTAFGQAEKVVVWNVDDPETQLIIENTAGAGYTHWDGGTPVAYAADVIAINNDYGPKLYWPIYPVATPISMGGKVLTGGARYRLVRAAPIT